MGKIDDDFPMDLFRMLHRPIRLEDADNDNFIERFLTGQQKSWEDLSESILALRKIYQPEECREDLLQYLKDIVGLTRDLRNITDALDTADLRKVILLAIPLWKTKGLEVGFKNTIKLFTGFNARVYDWFDYRMIIGEKALGEEQLGEDSWLISRPDVEGSEPLGSPFMILQFNDATLRDGSEYVNPVQSYGTTSFSMGGPFGNSIFSLKGVDLILHIPHRSHFDFTGNFTVEMFTKTGIVQDVILLNKMVGTVGVKLEYDISHQIKYTIGDGTTTQTNTVASGITFSDNIWKHICWSVDWDEGTLGKIAVWVDGTRVIYDDINGALVKTNIKNEADMFIGDTTVLGSGFDGFVDGIRMTTDNRYAVTLATITPPTTNFTEYIEEQLDEYQIDVRVVDDSTLDRNVLKSILNLMRPSSERINIIYIDFFDDFESGKGQWNTISGSGYTEKTDEKSYLKLPELSFEQVEVNGYTNWKDYLVQHRVTIYAGDEFEVRFLITNSINYYSFRINTTDKKAYLEKVVTGVRTSLTSSVDIDVETSNLPLYMPFYVYTVSVAYNEDTGFTTIKCHIDSNKTLKAVDNTFTEGTFGLATSSGTTIWESECEMFQIPLDYDKIKPNDEF